MTFDVAGFIKSNEGLSLSLKPDSGNTWQIGYGRNLSRRGITKSEAETLFTNDLVAATNGAATALGNAWFGLDDVRRGALVDMCFELGQAGLAQFKDMLAAIRASQWQLAYAACLDSAYAEQVPARAQRVALMLKTGVSPNDTP